MVFSHVTCNKMSCWRVIATEVSIQFLYTLSVLEEGAPDLLLKYRLAAM